MNWKMTATAVGLGAARLDRRRPRRRRAQHLQLGQLHQPRADQEVRGQPTRSRSPSPTMIPTTPRSPRSARAATASTSSCRRRTIVPIWINEGLLLETDPDQMENFKNMAQEWVDSDFDTGRNYSVPWQWGTIGVVVNTDVYKGDINTWAHHLRPAGRAEGQGQCRARDERRHPRRRSSIIGGEQCTGDKDDPEEGPRHAGRRQAELDVAMEYGTIEKMAPGDFAATSDWNGSAFRQRLQNPADPLRLSEGRLRRSGWTTSSCSRTPRTSRTPSCSRTSSWIRRTPRMISAFARYANGIKGSDKFMPADMKDAPEVNVPAEFVDKGEFLPDLPAGSPGALHQDLDRTAEVGESRQPGGHAAGFSPTYRPPAAWLRYWPRWTVAPKVPAMSDLDLCYMPAAEALKRFKAKKLSPVELMQAVIARAESDQGQGQRLHLHPFRRSARAREEGRGANTPSGATTGALEGLPIASRTRATSRASRPRAAR